MLIEDHVLVREAVGLLLHEAGYDVYEASDGHAGIEEARRIRPDVVVTDIRMPDLNGVDVLRELKADPELGDVPVIILTIVNDGSCREECLDLGACAYLDKANGVAELVLTIENVLLQRSGPNRA